MSQFKAMKFYIGDDPALSEKVQKLLFSMGYGWHGGEDTSIHAIHAYYLYTGSYHPAQLDWDPAEYPYDEFMKDSRHELINIDWLRTPKKETIELNGKKYLKEDLEEALKHIRPVE